MRRSLAVSKYLCFFALILVILASSAVLAQSSNVSVFATGFNNPFVA
jgi:predicted nucleotide-binding protein (sugar kinase/HSP70/actin superfamily)